MQTGGDPNLGCVCCACKAALATRVVVLEVKDKVQVEMLTEITADIKTLLADKQKMAGAIGVLAILGAGAVWVASKLIDHLFSKLS